MPLLNLSEENVEKDIDGKQRCEKSIAMTLFDPERLTPDPGENCVVSQVPFPKMAS